MGFASGFAAGSAAVERGLALAEASRKRKEEEQYKAQMAELANEYQMSQGAVTAYEQQRAGLEATGAPMASAVAQPQYSPEAQQIFGIGGPAPQMSMSPVSAPTAGLVAGDRAGVVMPEAPQAMSSMDLRQRAATLALGAGRYDDYMAAQEALAAEQARERQLGFEERRLGLSEARAQRDEKLFEINLEDARNRRQLSDWALADEKAVRGFGAAYQNAVANAAGQGKLFTVADAVALPEYQKLSLKQQQGVVQDFTGRSIAEQQAVTAQIQSDIQGKSLDQLLSEHESNKYLTPGQHFEKVYETDKDGNEVLSGLQLVDSKTRKPAGEVIKLGSEQQALKYLYEASLNPVVGAEYASSIESAAAAAAQKAKELGIKVDANTINQRKLLVDAYDKADAEIAERSKMGEMTPGDIDEVYSRYLGAAGAQSQQAEGIGGKPDWSTDTKEPTVTKTQRPVAEPIDLERASRVLASAPPTQARQMPPPQASRTGLTAQEDVLQSPIFSPYR